MNVPNHIAIILDGNGRWAKAKGMPRSYGHVKGCANLETVCDYMKELGVKYVTVYAFSTENWKRSKDEVDGLMKLFRSYLKKCIKLADKNKMSLYSHMFSIWFRSNSEIWCVKGRASCSVENFALQSFFTWRIRSCAINCTETDSVQ